MKNTTVSISVPYTHRRSWLRCMNTAATIVPFIAAMMSATAIATGTAKSNRATATVMTVKTISITNTIM